ncbi:MAG: hypothetical protein WBA51_18735 [Erythrobacter sp.]
MTNWYKMPPSYTISEKEYRANIDGMNIVFGAVLGFVLVGAEGLPVKDFALTLILSVAIVVMILYLGSSEYKLFHGLIAAISIYFLPDIAGGVLKLAHVPKLQPTLAIWATMVVVVELMPRTKTQTKQSQENQA